MRSTVPKTDSGALPKSFAFNAFCFNELPSARGNWLSCGGTPVALTSSFLSTALVKVRLTPLSAWQRRLSAFTLPSSPNDPAEIASCHQFRSLQMLQTDYVRTTPISYGTHQSWNRSLY